MPDPRGATPNQATAALSNGERAITGDALSTVWGWRLLVSVAVEYR